MKTEPLPLLEEQELTRYLREESQSMYPEAYSDGEIKILRAKVAFLISENSNCFDKFDASISYLAMNYFDRFISRHTMPTSLKKDADYCTRVVAISCLCIAWKMRNKNFRNEILLAFRPNLNIEKRDLAKNESLILRELDWRTYCINPLCFVSNFISLIDEQDERFKANVIELIIQAQGDIYFTQFKPSVIAASAILVACSVRPNSVNRDVFTGGDVKMDSVQLDACEQRMTDIAQKKISPKAEEADVAIEERDPLNFELNWTSDEFQDLRDEFVNLTMDPPVFPPEDVDSRPISSTKPKMD